MDCTLRTGLVHSSAKAFLVCQTLTRMNSPVYPTARAHGRVCPPATLKHESAVIRRDDGDPGASGRAAWPVLRDWTGGGGTMAARITSVCLGNRHRDGSQPGQK